MIGKAKLKKTCSKCGRTRKLKFFGNDIRYRLGVKGWCKQCELNYSREPIAKKRARKRRKKWIADPKVRERERIRSRKKYWANPRRAKDRSFRRLYNISLDFHEKAKRCCICKKIPKRLCADHNHKTGKYRGALCQFCNLMIGRFDQYPKLWKRIKQYLKRGL
jgi:hypothetical protein